MNHPKRCETCRKKRTVHDDIGSWLEYLGSYSMQDPFMRCLVTDEIMDVGNYERICMRGCASYEPVQKVPCCETCSNCEPVSIELLRKGQLPYCNECDMSLSSDMIEWVERMGCYYHSSLKLKRLMSGEDDEP